MNINKMRYFFVLLLGALAWVAACSDDDDKGDAAVPDSKVGTDKGVDLQPDKGVDGPIKSDGSMASTFTLAGKVSFSLSPVLSCDAKDKNKDCAGNMYLGVYDKKPEQSNPGTPFFMTEIKDVKKDSTFKVTKVPVKAKLWVTAVLDDNGNGSSTNPAPDKGDVVFMSSTPIIPKAGQTVTQDIAFNFRMDK